MECGKAGPWFVCGMKLGTCTGCSKDAALNLHSLTLYVPLHGPMASSLTGFHCTRKTISFGLLFVHEIADVKRVAFVVILEDESLGRS